MDIIVFTAIKFFEKQIHKNSAIMGLPTCEDSVKEILSKKNQYYKCAIVALKNSLPARDEFRSMVENDEVQELLQWLKKQDYLNSTTLDYDYDENPQLDVSPLSIDEVLQEYHIARANGDI